jgi:lipid II:glycine glycyltransferase (peptidoglycan interpeptide bridge formation enzyme)
VRTTLVVDLTQDEQSIWNNIRRKRRGDIRRAQRLGVVIVVDTEFKFWDKWFESVKKVRERIGKPLYPWMKGKKTDGILVIAYLKGQVLAGEWYTIEGKTLRTRIAASRSYDTKTLAGNAHALLIWETMKRAKKQGLKRFDFGGYDPSGHYKGVNEWKASFGGVRIDL